MPARRFEAKPQTSMRELTATMRKLGATSLVVNQDIYKGSVEIVFDRGGRRYVFRCTKWADPADNLRAAQLTISYLYRAMEEYGTTQTEQALDTAFAQFFLPFEATPDDTVLLLGAGSSTWWQILGVKEDAAKAEIVNAYRALAKVHHPDHGGNAADFIRVRRAYEEGLRERGDV